MSGATAAPTTTTSPSGGGAASDAATTAAAAPPPPPRSRSATTGGSAAIAPTATAASTRPLSPPLPMEPLPRDVERPLPNPTVEWPAALGNAADAAVAADALRALLADAVFLDEEAFSSAGGDGGGGGADGDASGNATNNSLSAAQRYHSRLAASRERERSLELSMRALRDELARAGEALAAAREEARRQRQRADDLAQQLEANAKVFSLHYEEIALRTAECERLKGVVEELSSSRQGAAGAGGGAARGGDRNDDADDSPP